MSEANRSGWIGIYPRLNDLSSLISCNHCAVFNANTFRLILSNVVSRLANNFLIRLEKKMSIFFTETWNALTIQHSRSSNRNICGSPNQRKMGPSAQNFKILEFAFRVEFCSWRVWVCSPSQYFNALTDFLKTWRECQTNGQKPYICSSDSLPLHLTDVYSNL